jgi:quercetin dioxygenase-like cupin family protein/oxalate decarboxylase/phosphoglucose isomerase-like protein (cupin superfamily)
VIKGQKVEIGGKTPYQKWVAAQSIPVIRDFYIEDLRKVELAPWDWKGGRGVYLNLIGTGDANDAYICEIAPGGSLKPQRVLFEEMIFVIEGNGSSSVWNDENKKVTFEWQEGSLFSPPINTWRQHFNGSGKRPARFLVVTSAPPIINMFRNMDFVLNNTFCFDDRFGAEPDTFSGDGESYKVDAVTVWDTNFVPNVRTIPLHLRRNRGAGGSFLQIELAENAMTAHISEFPVGTYKKAHRHGAGAHVVIIGGEGYSLMWPEGEPIKRFDWHDGSVIVPPERWFHQHFNTGATPARYLALRWGSRKHARPLGKSYGTDESVKTGGDQIEYADEDPQIRRLFEQELAKRGVACRMDEVLSAAAS